MAIQDTSTFDLRDVTDEFGLENGDSLQDCFGDSSSGDFDSSWNPNSNGTNNNLLNFRNYGGSPTLYGYSIRHSTNTVNTCASNVHVNVWQYSIFFDLTKTMYSNSSASASPQAYWYKNTFGDAIRYWNGSAWSGSIVNCSL
jgi:hypothetical protein